MGNGFIPLPLARQRFAQIILGIRVIRFELERPLEVLNGFSQFPLPGQRDAQGISASG